MNGLIVTLQPRGQITLPKKYRDALGVDAGAVLKTSLWGRKVLVEPLQDRIDPYEVKPKVSRAVYLRVLKKISADIKRNGPLWTEDDDKRRNESLRKEREKWARLKW